MPTNDNPVPGGRAAEHRELQRDQRRREALADALASAVLCQHAARRAVNDGQTEVETLTAALDHARAEEQAYDFAGRLAVLVGGKPETLIERATKNVIATREALLAGCPPWQAEAPIMPAPLRIAGSAG